MQINDEARDALKVILKENNAPGIRIFFNGFG